MDLVQHIKCEVVPALFAQPASLGDYGFIEGARDAMDSLGKLLEAGPVTRLAQAIREIVLRLEDADPQKIAKPSTWLERFMGRDVEATVRYQVARKQLDKLLNEAARAGKSVRDAIAAIDNLLSQHEEQVAHLQAHISAGQQFLDENPAAGIPVPGAIQFDNVRERFARKLANLATLVASHEMSVTQMKLTKAQAIDLLDRYEEAAGVLVPVWRQHALTLTQSKHMNAALVAEATKAHEALLKSLAHSMNGIER